MAGAPWDANTLNGYIEGLLVYKNSSKNDLTGCSPNATGKITIPNTVTNIGYRAFSGCSGLTYVTIPNSVTSIGSSAFSGCSGLSLINIPNSVKSLDSYSYSCGIFAGCSNLTSISIPNSVSSIGDYAFAGCSSLTSIIIPNSINHIDECAFRNCKQLTRIYSYATNVPRIYDETFFEFPLEDATLYVPEESLDAYKSAEGWKNFGAILSLADVTDEDTDKKSYLYGSFANIPNNYIPIVGSGWRIHRGDAIRTPGADGYVNGNCVTGALGPRIFDLAFQNMKGKGVYLADSGSGDRWISLTYGEFLTYRQSNGMEHPEKTLDLKASKYKITYYSALWSYTGAKLFFEIIPQSEGYNGTPIFTKEVTVETKSPMRDASDSSVEAMKTEFLWDCPAEGKYIIRFYAYGEAFVGNISIVDAENTEEGAFDINKFFIEDFTISQGETKDVNIILQNTDALSAFQADIVLPQQLTIVSQYDADAEENVPFMLTSRKSSNHEMLCTDKGNGTYRLLANSMKGKTFTGNDGALVTFKVKANDTYTGSAQIKVTGIRFSDPTTKGYPMEESVCNVTISAKAPHIHSLTTTDNGDGTHTTTCSDCEYSETANHTYSNGTCTACGAKEPKDEDTDITAFENVVFFEKAEASTGQQITLSMMMNNVIAPTGFQCDLYLPDGITVAKDEDDFNLISLSTKRTTAQKTNYFDSAKQPDGSVRIMCSSTKNYTFSANEGEVALVTLNISEDIDEGDYPIILKNIVLSDAASNSYEVDYVKSTLTISSYTLGDANNDGKINVSDFSAIAGYIMGTPPATFVEKAADVNIDNKINVSDLTGVATIILYGSVNPSSNAKAYNNSVAGVDVLKVKDCNVSSGTEFTIGVNINGNSAFSGYQFDMTLPTGITVKHIGEEPCVGLSYDRTDSRNTDFFTSRMIEDNKVRVLAASTHNKYFTGTEGCVAYITLVADKNIPEGTYTVDVDNIAIAANGMGKELNSSTFTITAGETTGIHCINGMNNADTTVYDITGKAVKSPSSLGSVRKGVYIMNGKKIVK